MPISTASNDEQQAKDEVEKGFSAVKLAWARRVTVFSLSATAA